MDAFAEAVSQRDLEIVGIAQLTDTEAEAHNKERQLVLRQITWTFYAQPFVVLVSIAVAVCWRFRSLDALLSI